MERPRKPGCAARLLALGAAVQLTACGVFTPQREEDLPYRSGTLEHYHDGTLREAKLVAPTEVDGYPCARWVGFHRNGRLESCELAREAEVAGHVLPETTVLFLAPDGTLEHVFLGRDAVLDGIPCNGGGKIMVGFHPDGRLAYAFLSRDAWIDGVPCEASVFEPVRFHPNGRLAGCKLSQHFELDGVALRRGEVVELTPDGRLVRDGAAPAPRDESGDHGDGQADATA